MSTFKNYEIYRSKPVLDRIIKERMNPLVALKLRSLFRLIVPRYEDVESERGKLIDLYGQKDKEGKLVQGPKDSNGNSTIILADAESYGRDIEILMSDEFEIGEEKLITSEDIKTMEKISAEDLIILGELVRE